MAYGEWLMANAIAICYLLYAIRHFLSASLQLLRQQKQIHPTPMLDHFPVFKSDDFKCRDSHRSAGRFDIQKISALSSAHGRVQRNEISFGD